MAVTEAVISFAVEKIGDLIVQEAILLYTVRRRVKELRKELIRMRCFLRDAESRKGDSERIRNWVAEIRNIAYDAEDVLEIYALEAASRSSSRSCFSRSILRWIKLPISLHKVGSEIDNITASLAKLTASLPTYGLKDIERPASSSETKSLRKSYSHKIEQNVVGLEEDTNLLLTQLVRTDCLVVSICGMGGLGKTTLAKKVYHQCKVGHKFDFFIWVSVSQQWKKRNIWETLLYKLISPKESLFGDEQNQNDTAFKTKWKNIQKLEDDAEVAKMLHDELRKRKCLVVLDDIWENVWDPLKPGFPTEETSSKFMITTRHKDLAPHVGQNGYIHEPRFLNEGDSWELFTKTAIAAYRIDESMEKLGREMVKHCGGLPLAIVVLGGLLSTKRTCGEWDTIHQCIKSYLKGKDLGIFDQVLALSYDDLPYELKPCFLYLGVLPEDFEISRDRLINLWVAEGIIYPPLPRMERDGEEALEDIAYRYLTELAERYMIIVARRDSSGRIKRCQMHDLMRDFCLSKSEEENFFQVHKISSSSSSAVVTGRFRRLSLHLNNFPGDVAVELECEKYSPFRSIIGFSLDRQSGINQTLMETFVRHFKLLRILDLEKVMGFAIPQTIGKLIHLRYLNLRSAWIGNLPPSIGNLSCLLTLRLDPWDSAETIPNVFRKLKRLRHLYLPRSCGSNTERLQFKNLSHLRILVNFPTSNADVDDLISLTNLRKLKIVISDVISLQRFKEIFESPTITFSYLRDFSINLCGFLESGDVDNIKSRCPRLLRLKQNGNVVYQKTPDVFRLEED